jgi:hypothetical protein
MTVKLSFPRDSTDQIEQYWWPTLSKNFPNYAQFWEDYIGRKEIQGRLLPYGLQIPPLIPANRRTEIEDAYSLLVLSHYSLFCEIAGAYRQLKEAKCADSSGPGPDRLFLFIEAFNAFYDHLGTARNMLIRTWTQAERMNGGPFRQGAVQASTPAVVIEKYLRLTKNTVVLNLLLDVESDIIAIRNDHIHQFSGYFALIGGRFYLLPPTSASQSRLQSRTKPPPAELATVRMSQDLVRLEQLSDGSDGLLSPELALWLQREGIGVEY